MASLLGHDERRPRRQLPLVQVPQQCRQACLASEFIAASPNGVSGSLDAVEAKYGIPVIYTSSDRALAEEKAASMLSKLFTYWWLEERGLGRVLQEGDL